jgi:hypothetical protein
MAPVIVCSFDFEYKKVVNVKNMSMGRSVFMQQKSVGLVESFGRYFTFLSL